MLMIVYQIVSHLCVCETFSLHGEVVSAGDTLTRGVFLEFLPKQRLHNYCRRCGIKLI